METVRAAPPEKGPRIRGMQAAGGSDVPAPKTKATPPAPPSTTAASQKQCKWFAKTDAGCKRGAECQFAHEWGSTPKAGRCLVCSSTSHVKKDCPTREKGPGSGQRARGDQQQRSSSSTTPATRAVSVPQEPTAASTQPAAEPSPVQSPTERGRNPEEGERSRMPRRCSSQ